jgi:hypothetical protein
VKKLDMCDPKKIGDNGLNHLKLADFSPPSGAGKDTNAIVLKEKMLPELYRRHIILAEYCVVIVSLECVQAAEDMEQVYEVVSERVRRNAYGLRSRLSSWKKTVRSITGREIGKGTLIDVVV